MNEFNKIKINYKRDLTDRVNMTIVQTLQPDIRQSKRPPKDAAVVRSRPDSCYGDETRDDEAERERVMCRSGTSWSRRVAGALTLEAVRTVRPVTT